MHYAAAFDAAIRYALRRAPRCYADAAADMMPSMITPCYAISFAAIDTPADAATLRLAAPFIAAYCRRFSFHDAAAAATYAITPAARHITAATPACC